MKAAVGALGYNPEQLEVLILQMVSLYRNGELVKNVETYRPERYLK